MPVPYGITPTGPAGEYRRWDYLRGALISATAAAVLSATLYVTIGIIGSSSPSVPWIGAILGGGALLAAAATLILLLYAALGLRTPPAFADPTPPVREDPDDLMKL